MSNVINQIKHSFFEQLHRGGWRHIIRDNMPLALRKYLIDKHAHKNLFPRTISIETTNVCNAKCWFCPTPTSKRINGLMDVSLYENIIDQISPYSEQIDTIALFMDGEPTLHKKLVHFLQYAKKKGIKRIFMSSNMEYFTNKLVDSIMNEDLGETLQYINCSLDGVSAEVFGQNRIGVDFNKAVDNTEYLIKKRNEYGYEYPWVFTRLLVNDLNEKEEKSFIDRWEGVADKVLTTDMHNWAGKIGTENIKNPKKSKKPSLCYFPWSQIAIQYDGIVRLCCMDTDTEVVMGDLNKESINDIWNGENYRKFRDNMLVNNVPDICKNCTYPEKGTWLQPFYW